MYKLTSIALLCVLTFGLMAADTPAPAPVVQSEAGKKSLARIRQLGGLVLELCAERSTSGGVLSAGRWQMDG